MLPDTPRSDSAGSASNVLTLIEISSNGRFKTLPASLSASHPGLRIGDVWTGHCWGPFAKRALHYLAKNETYDGPIWTKPTADQRAERLWVQVRKDATGALYVLTWPGMARRETGQLAQRRDVLKRLHTIQAMMEGFAAELSTPALTLRGAAKSLTGKDAVDTRALGELIRSASERAALTCQDISLLLGQDGASGPQGAVTTGEQSIIDLRDAISEAAFPFRGEAAAMGLRLKTSRAESPVFARLDGACFKAIIARLIGCALRHAHDGSALMLRAENVAERDTGAGRAHVWIWIEPSPTRGETQPACARPVNGPNRDLNLKAARLLANRMDGHVVIEPNAEGSPAIHLEVAADAVTESRAQPSARKPVALIADDHLKQRRMASLQLEALGYDTIEVGDGDQAVRAFASQRIDLVILDWRMPKLDGVAASQKIRALNPRGAKVPILIATAETGFAAARLAERAGADRVLFKPLQAIDYAMALPGSEAAPQAGKDKPSASAA